MTVYPPTRSPLGMNSLMHEWAMLAKCFAQPPPFPLSDDLSDGEGQNVLLVPGFMAGDWTMKRLGHFLSGLGYNVVYAGIVLNPGPTTTILSRVEGRLIELSAQGPVNVVGQSFGGIIARGLALQHAGAIRALVTLGTPIRFPIVTPLSGLAHLMAPFHDESWLQMRTAIAGSFGFPITALYTKDDGVVDWQQCLQDPAPGYRDVDVGGAHMTMGSSPHAQRVIAEALAKAE